MNLGSVTSRLRLEVQFCYLQGVWFGGRKWPFWSHSALVCEAGEVGTVTVPLRDEVRRVRGSCLRSSPGRLASLRCYLLAVTAAGTRCMTPVFNGEARQSEVTDHR